MIWDAASLTLPSGLQHLHEFESYFAINRSFVCNTDGYVRVVDKSTLSRTKGEKSTAFVGGSIINVNRIRVISK